MAANKKTILKSLTRARLIELAQGLDIGGLTGKSKSDIIGALARRRSVTVPDLLSRLSRDELKEACRQAGLDDSGREKAVLIARIKGEEDFELTPLPVRGTQTGPPPKPGRKASKDRSKRRMAGEKKSKKKEIEQYEHKDKQRLNNPPVGLVDAGSDRDESVKEYAKLAPGRGPGIRLL